MRTISSYCRLAALATLIFGSACERAADPVVVAALDAELRADLEERGFTGRIESTLEERLGRPVDGSLAEIGRLLFFDPILSLTRDISCSGCHGPNVSFNGSQPIAIGVGNNGVVGPGRRGPHNQRRAPSILNAAFFPRLMWDSRFTSAAIDPFDNSRGFNFPPPDGPALSHMEHLLGAQAFTPVINRFEMAGSFDGDHTTMRAEVARRVDAIPEYRQRFAEVFAGIAEGTALDFEHIARALAEFQFTLVRADAPIDRFARGETDAMTPDEKRGALLFFHIRSKCGECHIVKGFANEMFSDFEPHVLGVPQVVPTNGIQPFDGSGADEDYGLEQQSGREQDRYAFRTQSLRNVAYQPFYMHNGAYRCLSKAIRHHLDVQARVGNYTTDHLPPTLQKVGPMEAVLQRLHPFIGSPDEELSDEQFDLILTFVRDALTDTDAAPEALRFLVPAAVPSGLPVHDFDFSATAGGGC
jgi:cytochrome c peroxidase